MKATDTIFTFVFAAAMLVSCKGEITPDKQIADMISKGETIYAAKMDGIEAHAGLNRVQIAGTLIYGMDTEKCVITWNPGDGLVEIPIERVEQEETFEYYVEGLAEGTYDFVVTTYDRAGHASIPTSVSGKSYGDRYLSTLKVRSLFECIPSAQSLTLEFAAESSDAVKTVLSYLDESGEQCEIVVPKTTNEIVLDNWMPEGKYSVETFFIPESGAIDEFSVSEEGYFPERPSEKVVVPVAKSGFRELILEGDLLLNAWAGALKKGWDGDKSSGNFAHSDNTAPKELPLWYTFDMGQTCQLCKYVHFGNPTENRIFDGGSMKSWEIYGRPDEPSDGSWEGWTLLAQCESYKPSGLPNGQITQADKDRWFAGEEFEIPTRGVPEVRYVRIKVLDTWAHEGWILFSEFDLYKYE